ncbi:restriction endonuclease subunit S, partial [Cetobacterium sp. ZOR0034]
NGEPYRSSGGKMVDSELGEIPEGWEIKELSNVIEFSNGCAFKSNELLDIKPEDGYSIFKMGNIKKGGGICKEKTKSFVSKEVASKYKKFFAKDGDLLMCMTDMKANVSLLGHTALMDIDNEFLINQRVGILKIKDETSIDYPFLYFLTNSNNFINNIRSKANSGVQVNLSTAVIKEMKFVAPSIKIHQEINVNLKVILKKISILSFENKILTEIRDTLLPKLMSGEIEV